MPDQRPFPPRTATVFDLPPRADSKADPRFIADDEHHFAVLQDSLERSMTELSVRIDALRTAPARKGRQAVDRDMEIHDATSRLRTLQRYSVDLCLGRMRGDDTTYIGRLGLTAPDGRQLLVDWRTPMAEPFFAATPAAPLGLVDRRRYRWTQGRITDYWDEVFTSATTRDDVVLDEDSAFIASLGASRSPRMRDVLGTIAADQDAIIRADSHGALVVDGGPGTGKTVVALHRAAYLLYTDPRLKGNRGGVLVVGPHEPYLGYVADVLPSLGEHSVATCTLRDLLPEGEIAVAEADSSVAGLKSSARMIDAIETAVRWYEEAPAQRIVVETEWADVALTRSDWAEVFAAPDPGTPHNEARPQIWDALAAIVADRIGDEVPTADVRTSLARNKELAAVVHRTWPMLDAEDIVGDLWSVPAFLRMCAPWLSAEDRQLLQRTDVRAWTVADLPLLDAARYRLGDRDADRRAQQRAATLAAERRRMDDVVQDLLDANVHDDGEGLMSMLRQEDLRDVLVDEGAADAATPDALAGPFAHIIVDEAQELTDTEWRMLLRRCPSRSFTVVGDRAQARHGFTESWGERLERVGLRDTRTLSLTINYRTPEEIMTAAAPVIRTAIPDANVPTSIRSNGIPVHNAPIGQRDQILDDWLRANPDGTACVIGDPSFAGRDRVRSLTPVTAKGLEFDLVVLAEPERFGDGIEGAVDRYVAMTRATQRLVVLSGGQ
ncbi:RNA polymerase recycling motor ATPase HelR [Gordonia sp. CPCC 205515]|uniref:RNA polymerase recycling motor ATPase HelR n=1 Tax=Gordonia sp. CPCC 205515 TaxID=3140791 RepID=UPI003AF3EEE0